MLFVQESEAAQRLGAGKPAGLSVGMGDCVRSDHQRVFVRLLSV